MRNLVPIIVTHPCTIFRDGLRQVLINTQFRPVHMAAELDEASEKYLSSAEACIWLMGEEKCSASTNDLMRRMVAISPNVKPVILAVSHAAHDVVPALRAGACGFLCEDISCERLIKSLELIALGETIVHTEFFQGAWTAADTSSPKTQASLKDQLTPTLLWETQVAAQVPLKPPMSNRALDTADGASVGFAAEVARGLSRREILILRALMEGASNKVIARQLVITEATVKVHVKAILRKLRLQNRTQAAMWARNHLLEGEGRDQSHIACI